MSFLFHCLITNEIVNNVHALGTEQSLRFYKLMEISVVDII